MTPVFVGTSHIITSLGFSTSGNCRRLKSGQSCLSGWMECYGDHCESFLSLVEQKEIIKQLKKPSEYIIFDSLSVEKLFKGNATLWKS